MLYLLDMEQVSIPVKLKELSKLLYLDNLVVKNCLMETKGPEVFKLIHQSDMRFPLPAGEIRIQEDFFIWVIDHRSPYSELVPSKSLVLSKASKTIPFERSSYVYFLIQGDEIVYIGQTVSVAARIATHVNDGKVFDKVYVITTDKDRVTLEGACINEHNPKLNKNSRHGDYDNCILLRKCVESYLRLNICLL